MGLHPEINISRMARILVRMLIVNGALVTSDIGNHWCKLAWCCHETWQKDVMACVSGRPPAWVHRQPGGQPEWCRPHTERAASWGTWTPAYPECPSAQPEPSPLWDHPQQNQSYGGSAPEYTDQTNMQVGTQTNRNSEQEKRFMQIVQCVCVFFLPLL